MTKQTPEVRPGRFVQPPGALLRAVPDPASKAGQLKQLWSEIGRCLAYAKPDGWRIQLHIADGKTNMFSRTGKEWTKSFESVAEDVGGFFGDRESMFDTELVGFDRAGHHVPPENLRRATSHVCIVLDTLVLDGSDVTSLSAYERVSLLKNIPGLSTGRILSLAKFIEIESYEELFKHYSHCLSLGDKGYDGMIIKRRDQQYFSSAIKVKPRDTIDPVVIGAYFNSPGEVSSLLLAVIDDRTDLWIPIAKVVRDPSGWPAVWKASKRFALSDRPPDVYAPPDIPDVWIEPKVVVKITFERIREGSKGTYLVRVDSPREVTIRYDKGPEQATTYNDLLAMAGLGRSPMQLPFFDDQSQ